MRGLALLAIIAGRQAFALASLALAAFLMTLWNPLLLWDVGFQLSFAATLGLILFVPPLEGHFESLLSRRLSEERAIERRVRHDREEKDRTIRDVEEWLEDKGDSGKKCASVFCPG